VAGAKSATISISREATKSEARSRGLRHLWPGQNPQQSRFRARPPNQKPAAAGFAICGRGKIRNNLDFARGHPIRSPQPRASPFVAGAKSEKLDFA
jgi:hypothetical protein